MKPARRCRCLASSALALVLSLAVAVPAGAEDPTTRYAGRTVVSVSFQAPVALDTDELRYLIEQEAGRPYSPSAVGRSVELLFRLGQFDEVQARVREVDGGVDLTFVLVPSPRIRRIELRGLRRMPGPEVRAALDKGSGDPYVTGDEERLARQVEAFYTARGYFDVQVTPEVVRSRLGGKIVRLAVVEGTPYRVSGFRVLPPEIAGYPQARIASWMAPTMRPGKVYREADLVLATQRLVEHYRRNGFVEVRILSAAAGRQLRRTPVEVDVDRDTKTVEVLLPIEAGHMVEARFEIDGRVRGAGGPGQKSWERVIGLDTARRVSDAYAEDAGRQYEAWLQRGGYHHARVQAAVSDEAWSPPASPPQEERAAIDAVRVLRFVVERGPRVTLRARDFVTTGNRAASTRDLLRVMTEASPAVIGHRPPFATFLGLPIFQRYYTQGEMEGAVTVLRDWYRARGFLDVQMDWEAIVPPMADGGPGRRVLLALEVDEGVQTRVESLAVDLDLPDRRKREWRGRVEGRPFNPAALEDLVRQAQGDLAESGHVDARVEASREFSDDRTLVRLRIKAERGPGVRFGQILVRQSRHTHVGLIRREVSDPPLHLLRPGEVYRPSRLAMAQRRLLRTGLFDAVTLRAAQGTGRVRDVEISVRERHRFSMLAGIGLTWPDDGPRLSGELRGRNLDGRGLSVFVRGRANLDWRFLLGVAPRLDYRASMGVELPLPPGVPVRATIAGVANEELDEPTYRVRRGSMGLSLAWRGSESVVVDLRGEVQWRVPVRIDEVARLSELADAPVARPKLADYQVMPMLGASLTIDRRDDPFNPSRGVFASLGVDTTPGRAVESAPAFGRGTALLIALFPFPRKVVLQVEAAGGLAWSFDGGLPPVEWRFRLGGTGTLRGFRPEAVGPWGTRPGLLEGAGLLEGDLPDRSVPVGGNAFYRYSVELQLPLVPLESWRFAIFHDAGNALLYGPVAAGIDPSRSPVLHWSAGVGLRRVTPIGPLRLDVAVRPTSLLRIPGAAIGEVVQIHFAVGAL